MFGMDKMTIASIVVAVVIMGTIIWKLYHGWLRTDGSPKSGGSGRREGRN